MALEQPDRAPQAGGAGPDVDTDRRDDPRDWLRMLVRLGAPQTTMLAAVALVSYAAPRLTCHPSQATLAAITGLSDGALREHLRRLRVAGVVDVVRGQPSSTYTLRWPDDEAAAADALGARRRPSRW